MESGLNVQMYVHMRGCRYIRRGYTYCTTGGRNLHYNAEYSYARAISYLDTEFHDRYGFWPNWKQPDRALPDCFEPHIREIMMTLEESTDTF